MAGWTMRQCLSVSEGSTRCGVGACFLLQRTPEVLLILPARLHGRVTLSFISFKAGMDIFLQGLRVFAVSGQCFSDK